MSGDLTYQLSVLGDPDGDAARCLEARSRLFDLLYAELHAIAGRVAGRGASGGTLQTTALLHEAYIRLVGADRLRVNDRQHFFAVAAMAMRRVLVDHVRAGRSLKRGGTRKRVPLDDLAGVYAERAIDLEVLDRGLEQLGAIDERAVSVVDLHFFGGLAFSEIAELFGLSARTIRRDLEFARTWLRRAFR